jgi:ABC-type multidrug transport system fused ATPase/permease subunit
MRFIPVTSDDLRTILGVLNRRDKFKLTALLISQLLLSFLDLAGIAVFGLLGALAVNGVSYKVPGSRLLMLLKFLNIDTYDFRLQAAILGLLATGLLVVRTILAIYFTRKTLGFLGRKSANITKNLFLSSMNKDYLAIKSLTTSEWVVGLTKGVNSITLRIIGGLVTMIADGFLLFLILLGLVVYNYQIALMTLFMFSSVGISMYILIKNRAHHSGKLEQELDIQLSQRITESILAYREIYLRNDQDYYANYISKLRNNQVVSQTVSSFFPLLSRYVFEAILVVGTLLVGATQFLLFDAVHAVATISIFMAASSRIAPAVMRIQQSAIVLKASQGSSEITLRLLREAGKEVNNEGQETGQQVTDFQGDVRISNLEFSYPDRESVSLNNFNLYINPGELIAFVGPTGSGKSTLVDLILGVLTPLAGKVEISKSPPRLAVVNWPGMISYVPQKVAVFNSSLRENITLGSSSKNCSDEDIWHALEMAELSNFVKQLPGQLEYQISDMGLNLSGGQVQRLGIARALISKPKLLILDEATSSLDGETEAAIARSINRLSGDVTVILVAHRLSTIRNAGRVVYLDHGRILSDGSIAKVRKDVPAFDAQCKEMGIETPPLQSL